MRAPLIVGSLGICAAAIAAANVGRTTQPSEREAVLRTVHAMTEAWREADPDKLAGVLHPDFREVTLHLNDGKWELAHVSREQLIDTVHKIDKGAWDDRLLDPEVHVDGPIAAVWSHYRFTVHFTDNGVVRSLPHCGVETFQLYRMEGAWKVVSFADTHAACETDAAR